MSFKGVFIMFVILGWFSFLGALGDSALGDIDGVSAILGFDVDKVAQGGGAVGVPRIVVSFFTITLPRFVTFNYSFMNDGSLQIFRVLLGTMFGGTIIVLFSLAGLGVLRRVF